MPNARHPEQDPVDPEQELMGEGKRRIGDLFLNHWRQLLGDHGFIPDPGEVERTASGGIVYYRYTHPEHLGAVLAAGGGLYARLPVVQSERSAELAGGYITEGLLEPLPRWLGHSLLRDLGLEMLRTVAGDLLLRVELPAGFPGLYVADFAHNLECAHSGRRGRAALGLGYDCTDGREATLAYLHSYVPVAEYRAGHVAPVFKVVRHGPGIAVPSRCIAIAGTQPWR